MDGSRQQLIITQIYAEAKDVMVLELQHPPSQNLIHFHPDAHNGSLEMHNSYTKGITGVAAQAPAISQVTYEDLLLQKIMSKLIPILFIAYFFSHLDRVNIGFSKLQMQSALEFSKNNWFLFSDPICDGRSRCVLFGQAFR